MNLPLRNSRISLSQGQIFWREVGQGPTLVFLHGSWNDSSQWLSVIENLSGDHQCLAPDLLGFSESEHPKIHYSIHLEVECLCEFLEALNLRQVYLVGHSLGGWIATSYALKYPDQVSGLVLLAPEGVTAEGLEKSRWWVRWLIGKPPIMYWGLRLLAFFAKFFRKQGKIRHLLQYRKKLLQSPAACQLLIQRRHSEINAELLQEQLEWLKVPVLILQGEHDQETVITRSQTYANLVPSSQLYTIEEGEHDLAQQLPEVVAKQIHQFVIQQESAERFKD